MIRSASPETLATLPSEANHILRGKPNHCLIPPELFMMIEGAGTIKSRDLAMHIVDVIKKGSLGLDDGDDEVTVVTARNLASAFEFLLSFLWASENDFLEPVELEDIPESPTIDQLLREIKGKIIIETEREGNLGSGEAWALSSQSIVRELNGMHASREEEENASLLKNMGPSQRALYKSLSTDDMEREP